LGKREPSPANFIHRWVTNNRSSSILLSNFSGSVMDAGWMCDSCSGAVPATAAVDHSAWALAHSWPSLF
jgi:hypothetical protein